MYLFFTSLSTKLNRIAGILLLWFLFVLELLAKGTRHITAFYLNLLSVELVTLAINCTSPGPCCFPSWLTRQCAGWLTPAVAQVLWRGAGRPKCFPALSAHPSSGQRAGSRRIFPSLSDQDVQTPSGHHNHIAGHQGTAAHFAQFDRPIIKTWFKMLLGTSCCCWQSVPRCASGLYTRECLQPQILSVCWRTLLRKTQPALREFRTCREELAKAQSCIPITDKRWQQELVVTKDQCSNPAHLWIEQFFFFFIWLYKISTQHLPNNTCNVTEGIFQ